MEVGVNHYLVLAGILFSIGLYGVLSRRNAVVMLMALELMFNSVNLTLIAFSRWVTPSLLTGQAFAIFVLTVAAAEATVGLAIVLAIYRNRASVSAEQVDELRG